MRDFPGEVLIYVPILYRYVSGWLYINTVTVGPVPRVFIGFAITFSDK